MIDNEEGMFIDSKGLNAPYVKVASEMAICHMWSIRLVCKKGNAL